jgi:hypothetical protein
VPFGCVIRRLRIPCHDETEETAGAEEFVVDFVEEYVRARECDQERV